MESKSQVLVTLRTGDQLVFDDADKKGFTAISADLRGHAEWICVENAIVCSKDILSVYFFPDGYSVKK